MPAVAAHVDIEPDEPDAILADRPATDAAFARRTELAGVDGVSVSGHAPLVHARHDVLARADGLLTVLSPPDASRR